MKPQNLTRRFFTLSQAEERLGNKHEPGGLLHRAATTANSLLLVGLPWTSAKVRIDRECADPGFGKYFLSHLAIVKRTDDSEQSDVFEGRIFGLFRPSEQILLEIELTGVCHAGVVVAATSESACFGPANETENRLDVAWADATFERPITAENLFVSDHVMAKLLANQEPSAPNLPATLTHSSSKTLNQQRAFAEQLGWLIGRAVADNDNREPMAIIMELLESSEYAHMIHSPYALHSALVQESRKKRTKQPEVGKLEVGGDALARWLKKQQ